MSRDEVLFSVGGIWCVIFFFLTMFLLVFFCQYDSFLLSIFLKFQIFLFVLLRTQKKKSEIFCNYFFFFYFIFKVLSILWSEQKKMLKKNKIVFSSGAKFLKKSRQYNKNEDKNERKKKRNIFRGWSVLSVEKKINDKYASCSSCIITFFPDTIYVYGCPIAT